MQNRRGFERGFSIDVFLSFGCICRVSREGFHLSFVAYVWGWPFRLVTSRVRATRRHEPTMSGACSGLSLVTSDWCFFVRSVVACIIYPCLWSPGNVLWSVFAEIYHVYVSYCLRVAVL